MANFTIPEHLKTQLQTQGYIRLENAVPPELLSRWQMLAEQLEARALAAYADGESLEGCCLSEDPAGTRLARYNSMHLVETQAALEMQACPAMMAVARELCGPRTVPVQMDMLYKQQHPHPVVQWHQDAPHPRNYPWLNVGVFLDDAPVGDGCISYVPGTQHKVQDVEQISRKYGWEVPGVVEEPACAGDIVIHDMMVLHGSQPKRSPGVRRTLYMEYRPMEGIFDSAVQSPAWAELRRDWMAAVLRHADSRDWPDAWRDDYPKPAGSDAQIMAAIRTRTEPGIAGNWGVFPVEHPDYPVPADLREG